MNALIVLGLQYGDEGKGITTDRLCSEYSVHNTIVIRFSGGQQAGHTVILNDVKHIHANFGSGTLRGFASYFSEHCCIYLNTIEEEKYILNKKKITPELYIHPLTKLTTPYDVAFNRVTELENNHGSCGLGVGATMKRNDESGFKLFACDLFYPELIKQKLKNIRNYYFYKLSDSYSKTKYLEFLSSEEEVFFDLINEWQTLFQIKDYNFLKNNYENFIFEGSQGIMLDMDHGLFPNVTYANTTSKNAIQICKKLGISSVDLIYVTRCYQTRHGNGWMSNNDKIVLTNNNEEINVYNDWQKDFKVGELDYDLLIYALNIDKSYWDGIKVLSKTLMVTCMDQRENFVFNTNKVKNLIDFVKYWYTPHTKI